MKIINVTEVVDASVENITSFVIPNPAEEAERVEMAEQDFSAKAIANGASKFDMEDLIENGYYCQGGYSVFLTWSDVK